MSNHELNFINFTVIFFIVITVVENSQAAVTDLGKEINLTFLHSPCVL